MSFSHKEYRIRYTRFQFHQNIGRHLSFSVALVTSITSNNGTNNVFLFTDYQNICYELGIQTHSRRIELNWYFLRHYRHLYKADDLEKSQLNPHDEYILNTKRKWNAVTKHPAAQCDNEYITTNYIRSCCTRNLIIIQ